eukprot:TRINITY_DN27647_c0_g1_i1.p1 TRINITY_DN27647_c0_g1~~TRINITY_DN27647_c0_g1_i1.p1  ORF type:complete len:265 (+),score=32.53 TRINITY_DN27647_c0_g1_i1:108-797(+)
MDDPAAPEVSEDVTVTADLPSSSTPDVVMGEAPGIPDEQWDEDEDEAILGPSSGDGEELFAVGQVTVDSMVANFLHLVKEGGSKGCCRTFDELQAVMREVSVSHGAGPVVPFLSGAVTSRWRFRYGDDSLGQHVLKSSVTFEGGRREERRYCFGVDCVRLGKCKSLGSTSGVKAVKASPLTTTPPPQPTPPQPTPPGDAEMRTPRGIGPGKLPRGDRGKNYFRLKFRIV